MPPDIDQAPPHDDGDAPSNVRPLFAPPTLTPQDARWLGYQAKKRNAVGRGRRLVSEDRLDDYDAGANAADGVTFRPGMLDEAARRRLLRALSAPVDEEDGPPPLPIILEQIVQRLDVGTATRYDLTLSAGPKVFTLSDLRATDLLRWENLRPVALDARVVLPPLKKGQAAAWLAQVQRALSAATVEEQEPEDSEAMEVRALLRDLATTARPWSWSEDDPVPHGIARIEYQDMVGWPRGALTREVRAQLGQHASRVAFRRARESLGWRARDWKIETAHVRAWCIDAAKWPR